MARIDNNSIQALKDSINITDVVDFYLELNRKGANYKACCPFHGEKTPSFVVSPTKQIYNCFGCGAKGDAISFVMEYEKINYIEAIEKIAAIVNFQLDYKDKNYRPKKPVVLAKPKKMEKKVASFKPHLKKDVDLKEAYRSYKTLPLKKRMMLIYSFIYKFSLEQDQSEKIEYFAKREINLNHSSIDKLGFIPVKKFEELAQKLIKWFGKETLLELDVLNESLKFKLSYVKKSGVIVFPSFHIYQTNIVTSFMFRPTQPEKWMVESHMKEIQMSNNDLYLSAPFGLTYDFIANTNAIKCLVEGGLDTLCSDETFNGKDFLFIGSPGANGFKEEHLSLLRGQTLRIMLDPDNAGRMATYGSVTIRGEEYSERFAKDKKGLQEYGLMKRYLDLNKIQYFESHTNGYVQKCLDAGVIPELCSWDPKYGDLNDVRKLALSGKAPFKDMQEFFTKFVSVVRKNKLP